MIYDRQITISVGASRRATNWQAQTLTISELYDRLRLPAKSTETMAEYLALSKGQQDDLKDVGGYVAGVLNGPRRKAGAVAGRDVLTTTVLGGLKTVCVRGEGAEDLPAGLERRRVGLQEYFISLMEEEDQR